MSVVISSVEKKSIGSKKGIKAGDTLISINGNEISDVLDYRFYGDDEKLELCWKNSSGRLKNKTVKHCDGVDSLGLGFETYLMDKQRHCKNACIFCFIDQLPEGMRKSLYFKDDDSRLSFLFGNYITLTNLTEHDADRIIKMHISPVNVSVHTMNPELRVEMMKNPSAGKSLGFLKRFSDAGIAINAQLVLCPGINDGKELEYSLTQLSLLPSVQSIAAVPVGLTKYRDGLHPLEPFSPSGAADVIDAIDRFNEKLISDGRGKLAFPSDEFFQIAGRNIPDCDYYLDFPQLDNGVGLLALTEYDFMSALDNTPADVESRKLTLATGKAAYELINQLAEKFMKKFTASEIDVFCIENKFFGENVTVSGLVTGRDLINTLKGKIRSDLCIPSVMLKSSDEPVFLDDVSVSDVSAELNVNILVTDCSGDGLFNTLYERGRTDV